MAFIPAPNCVEIVVRFIWAGQVVAITLSFCRDDAVDIANMDDLIDGIEFWLANQLLDDLSDDISVVAIVARDLTTQDSFLLERAYTAAGEIADDTVPNNSTLVVTFETGLAGRSFRGRNYIPGIPKGALDSSVLVDPTVVANFIDAYAALNTLIEDSAYTHCVISRYHNKEARETAVSTVINGYSSDGFLDSQRRRLAGRGE